MKKFLSIAIALSLLAVVTTLRASHGQNFLLLEDYDIPQPGGGQITGTFDWELDDSVDSYSTEPSLLLGLFPNTAVSIAPRFADEAGGGWEYSSITPRLYFRLPKGEMPLHMGVSFGYQFAEGHDEAGSEEHHDEHGHESHHEDEAEPHTHGEGGGIDDHDSNLWHTRLLIEADLSEKTKAVFNLIGVFPQAGDAAWGYGLGVRHLVLETLALGLEARGDFASRGQHELLVGSYWSPVHDFTVRLGCGFGLTDETPDFVLRTGVIWRF